MRLDESHDNKGRHIGMQNDRKNVRKVNIGLVLLHETTRDKTFLVVMELADSPRG